MSTRFTHSERIGKRPYKYYLSMEEILARRQKVGGPVTDWNEELDKATENVLELTTAVIRKDGTKSKPFCIYSKKGKKLGCFETFKGAEKRLAEIEMFKHIKGDESNRLPGAGEP